MLRGIPVRSLDLAVTVVCVVCCVYDVCGGVGGRCICGVCVWCAGMMTWCGGICVQICVSLVCVPKHGGIYVFVCVCWCVGRVQCVCGVYVYGYVCAAVHTHSFLELLPAYPTWTRVLFLHSMAWLPPCPTSALTLSSPPPP